MTRKTGIPVYARIFGLIGAYGAGKSILPKSEWIRLHSPASPFVWVAGLALGEAATEALYNATPFVYVLPNFLPRYIHREFVHHLRKVWRVASIHTLKSAWHGATRVGADLAGR